MRIQTLRGAGIKGHSFSYELAPVTLLYADNFTGKTTVIETLQLALCGYVPGVAKKPNELFDRLASGSTMEAEAVTDTGERFFRSYKQVNGSVKYNGTEATFPAVALDPSEYLTLSGPAQTRYLFGCATLPQQCTVPNLTKTLQASFKNIKLEENTPESETVINELVAFVCGSAKQIPPQEWIAELAENLRLRKNAAAASVERMAKTGQGLAQVGSDQQPAPPDSEQRLHKATKAKAEADAECTKLSTQLDEKRRQWKDADARAKAGAGVDPELLRTQREEAELKLAQWMQSLPETDFQSAQQIQPVLDDADEAQGAAMREVDHCKYKISTLEEDAKLAAGSKCCPTCGHKPSAVEQKKTVAGINRKLKELRLDLAVASEKLVNAKTEAVRISKLLNEATEREKSKREVESAIASARTHIAEIDAKLAASENVTAATKAAEQALKDGSALKAKLEAAQQRQAELAPQLEQATTDFKMLLAQRASASAKAAAAAEGRKVRVEAEVLKAAVKIVAELQTDLVEASVGPLVERMNQLCAPIMPSKLYFEGGELRARDKDGANYSRYTLSGMQKSLSFCALSLALAAKSPVRIAILDEMGNLEEGRRVALLDHLIELCITGVIDQAVVIAASLKPLVPLHDAANEWFKAVEVK